MRFLWRAGGVLVAMLVIAVSAVACAAAWLVYTEAGLSWLSTRIAGYAGKGLTLDGVAGTLARGASVKHIRYAGEDIELHVTSAELRVSPLSLVRLRPRITALRAAEIAVVTKPGEPRGRPPDTLALPVDFELEDARVARLVIDVGNGPYELTQVRLHYAGGRTRHEVHELSLDALGYELGLRGTISALPPFRLAASVSAVRRGAPRADVHAELHGDLNDVGIVGGATSGAARIDATAHVRPYDALPLAALSAKTAGLDLNALLAALPSTSLTGVVSLKRADELYAGSVQVSNAAHGPYDQGRLPIAALRANLRTDGTTARVSDLVADLGSAGVVAGSGEIDQTTAKLALTTKHLDLAGIHTRMRHTELAGRADLIIARTRQTVTAELTQNEIALRLIAHRVGDKVDIPTFHARARGGEANGEVHLSFAAQQPFSIRTVLTRFNPAAWGAFPEGSISATVAAQGTLVGPQADVSFVIRDSRWLDAPLAARGAVRFAADRLRNADVEATLGGNHVSAQGALGGPQDTLSVRFSAPRLAILDKRLQGAARGAVQLAGSCRAPAIRFDVTGADLAHSAYGRIKVLEAHGALGIEANAPFELDAALRGISAPQGQLQSATFKLEGTRAAHSALVQAQGVRVDFRARARGAWKSGAGWTGTIQELINQGDVRVELTAPVSMSVGAQRAYAQPFELLFAGGRLAVRELDYDRGRLSTAGGFTDVPVRPLVTLAGGPGDMAGTLRLTGQWSIRNVPRLVGSIAVTRESGDVALGADSSIRLGLRTLAVKASFADEGATFQASIVSALANANAEGRVSPVGARYGADSPLEFTADVSVARLAPFASLIDTTVLIEGEARARLQGRGTVANPQITGPITADRLAIALPAEGVDLRGGTLRALLTERELRVESFSISGGQGELVAQGTLARTGFDEASVDWRANRFTVLARPDRQFVVTGKGNATLKSGKLAFTGNLKADEGLFELATTTLPKLGDDVIIVRRGAAANVATRTAAPDMKKIPRAIVDVTVDLGNNVHVTGRGLDVWLAGQVRVQTNALGEIRAMGTVDARRGTFVAYGQRLEIERGHLYFNGPLSDPGLDIVAMRKRQAVEAGVAVTGTLTRPLVQIVSNPPLPEGEALSWLVLGRAPDSAGTGQLSALPLATGAILGKAGNPLARAFRLDEIGLRGSSTVSEQVLTVGKRVTDRLYVVFEQSLGGAENLLRLELSLTQRISLRAQAGQTSLFGVFFRHGWD